MLNQRINEYTRAMYWGDQGRLSRLVSPQIRPIISKRIRARRRTENIVDTEVENVQFDKELQKATVDMKTRFYKISHNVVQSRFEKQTWLYYRYDGGWKLTEIEEVKDENIS